MKKIFSWLPEILLAAVTLFFAFRSLGTFPASWVDEGIFITVAHTLADGRGYAMPLLDELWHFPYFLAVGPAVIVPVALSSMLFGLSVEAARLPMTLYVILTCLTMYFFTRRLFDRTQALWATALLVTLSAFVNTGKPVLGEVPAFFFLLIGLFLYEKNGEIHKRSLAAGIAFGLSIMTKITYLLILPSLGIAACVAAFRRQWKELWAITLTGMISIVTYLPWRVLEAMHTPSGSLAEEISKFVFGGGETPVLYVLRENREILTRLPYLAYGTFFLLGMIGLWSARRKMNPTILITTATGILLFTLYFLNSFGWYRHLLPAHLLLLPFVPAGVRAIFGKKFSIMVLAPVILLQAHWQFTFRGSSLSPEGKQAAMYVLEHHRETDLLIQQPEVFARLPYNPHWYFLIDKAVSPSMPVHHYTPTGRFACMPRLRRLNEEEMANLDERAEHTGARRYFILPPAEDCPL